MKLNQHDKFQIIHWNNFFFIIQLLRLTEMAESWCAKSYRIMLWILLLQQQETTFIKKTSAEFPLQSLAAETSAQ